MLLEGLVKTASKGLVATNPGQLRRKYERDGFYVAYKVCASL